MLDRTMQPHPPHVVELLPCPSAAGGRRLRQTKRTRAYALDEHLDVWLDAIVVDGCVRHGCLCLVPCHCGLVSRSQPRARSVGGVPDQARQQ